MKTEIATIDPKEFGLEETKAAELTSGLTTILDERKVLTDLYKETILIEITPENLPKFKELRLKIRDNRTKGIEKWHKVNKEFFLTGGRFVDAIKNKEIAENERMEQALQDAENHFENIEKERLQKLRADRWAEIKTYIEHEPAGLDAMQQDVFDAFKSGLISQHERKIEAERIAEETRIAKEKAEAEERERVRIENERLKKEAEEKEKELQAEKAKADAERKAAEAKAAKLKAEADAKLKAEQAAKAKLEAELKAKSDAEEKARKDAEKKAADELKAKQLAEAKAAKAPDKDKLKSALELFTIGSPEMKTPEGEDALKQIKEKLAGFKKWATEKIESL